MFAVQESQTRCSELENERQRIQTDFENYYQQTQQLEESQQHKSMMNKNSDSIDQVARAEANQICTLTIDAFQNGVNTVETHGRFRVQSSAKRKTPLIDGSTYRTLSRCFGHRR
jgi:hypothetical protein